MALRFLKQYHSISWLFLVPQNTTRHWFLQSYPLYQLPTCHHVNYWTPLTHRQYHICRECVPWTAPPTPRQRLSVSIYRPSFSAIHYYNISEYACKSKKIISEKGKMFLKSLQNTQIIEYFTILFLSLIIIKYERKSLSRIFFELLLTHSNSITTKGATSTYK